MVLFEQRANLVKSNLNLLNHGRFMHNQHIIKLALKTQNINQKQLSEMLNVSPSQITKWKKDEHMSTAMRIKLTEMIPAFNEVPFELDEHPTGSENIKGWLAFTHCLVTERLSGNDNGINLNHYLDNDDISRKIMVALHVGGHEIPMINPLTLALVDYEDTGDEETLYSAGVNKDALEGFDFYWFEITSEYEGNHGLLPILESIVSSVCDLMCYYRAYLEDTIYDMLQHRLLDLSVDIDIEDPAMDVIVDLAIVKAEGWKPDFKFKRAVNNNSKNFIHKVKYCAFHNRIPMRVNIDRLITEQSKVLGHESEGFALGFNTYENKHHVDFYESKKISLLKEMLKVQYAQNKMLFEINSGAEEIFIKHLKEADEIDDFK